MTPLNDEEFKGRNLQLLFERLFKELLDKDIEAYATLNLRPDSFLISAPKSLVLDITTIGTDLHTHGSGGYAFRGVRIIEADLKDLYILRLKNEDLKDLVYIKIDRREGRWVKTGP
jgi:hypothetical protein